jgi:drug/metabolite transporter (DMT)-like permease
VALAAFGAACFATKGIFAKFLYAEGWNFEALLAIRMLWALPVVWAWALWKVGPAALLRGPRGAIAGAIGAGVLCYYLGALFNFYALTLIDASVERVLLFSYPTMVVILHSVLYRERPGTRVVAALALTYVGILVLVTGLDAAILRANLAGAGLVLVCALTFALYYLASDRWTRAIGSLPYTTWAITAATVCLASHYGLRHDYAEIEWTADGVALMAGIVVFATVLPMLSMAEAVRRLGAQRAAVVSTVGPPATILLAWWLLAERLTLAQWLGAALIVVGIVVLEYAKQKAPAPTPD